MGIEAKYVGVKKGIIIVGDRHELTGLTVGYS